MIKYYALYYKDIEICIFSVDNENILDYNINKSVSNYLPYGYTNNTIKNWIYNRGIPVTRDSVKGMLGKVSTFQFMLLNKGLSLTDHYWIKEIDENVLWSDVNCFTNSFKEVYNLDIINNILDITDYSNFTPSSSLSGDLKKKWVIDSVGNRILVKGNYGLSCIQSISEVLASEIHSKQNKFPFVKYEFIIIPTRYSDILGCCCLNFVTDNFDFISAADVIRLKGKKPKTLNELFNTFIDCCILEGLDYDYLRKFIDYQIMIDFILTNTDRHLNNFGVLRDSNTLRFMSVAPIFDTGNSMGYSLDEIPSGRSVLKINEQVGHLNEYEVKVLKHVKNKDLVDVNKLPSLDFVWSLLQNDYNISDERKERILNLYDYKVKFFTRFQNGEKIWLLK